VLQRGTLGFGDRGLAPGETSINGVTDRDDIRYNFPAFPDAGRQERVAYGRYRSGDLCLAFLSALLAGHPDAAVDL